METVQTKFRPTRQLKKAFSDKVRLLHAEDGYTTQNKVLIELINKWVTGRIVIPGEKR